MSECVVHDNFCAHGVHAIFRTITRGTHGIMLLACPIKSICDSETEHTGDCLRLVAHWSSNFRCVARRMPVLVGAERSGGMIYWGA